MVERDAEEKIIPYCIKNNIGFVPFSPIASGLLSGKITTSTQFEKNDDVSGKSKMIFMIDSKTKSDEIKVESKKEESQKTLWDKIKGLFN